jgi:hypothetical protein
MDSSYMSRSGRNTKQSNEPQICLHCSNEIPECWGFTYARRPRKSG